MVDDGAESVGATEADARVDASALSAGRGRRAVAVVDALAARLAPGFEGVAHVGLRASAGERPGRVLADGRGVAGVRLGALVDVDALVVLGLESGLAVADRQVVLGSARSLATGYSSTRIWRK